MKKGQWIEYRTGIYILGCLSIFLTSCESFNFSKPQPADKENMYAFPEELQGNWIDDKNDGSLYIGKQHLEVFETDTIKIIAGAWPRLDGNNDFIFSPTSYSNFKTIRYDSLKRPIDTIPNYLLRGNYLYEMNDLGLLGRAYLYRVDKDTTSITKNDTTIIELGRKAFLRRLSNDFWVLNISNEILDIYKDNDFNHWWQIVILEKKDDQHINLWYSTTKLEKQPAMFYSHNGYYYFDGAWTSAEMIKLIKDGTFKLGSKLIRDKKKA